MSKRKTIRVYRHLTFRNLLIACLAASVLSLVVSGMAGAITLTTWSTVPVVISAGSAVFFAYMIKNSRRIAYRDAVAGLHHHPQDFAATLLGPEIAEFIPEESFLSWVTEDKRHIGAKIYAVTDVPYSWKSMERGELEGRLRAYASTMSSRDLAIATYHVKLPIDKEGLMIGLRKGRDMYKSSYDVGGTMSHLDEAEKRDAVLQRIEQSLEQPYEARFFIVTWAEAEDPERLERKLSGFTTHIVNRFQNDIGVNVEELRDDELLEASRTFFPGAQMALKPPSSRRLEPLTVLSLDLAWQNPLIARRLPPLWKLLQGVYIGKTPDEIPVCWNPGIVPSHHITVLGPMGTGKTTFIKSFAYRAHLMLGIPSWIFDVAEEYAPFIRELGGTVIDLREKRVNPFVLNGADPVSVANGVAEMLTYLAGLRGDERFYFRTVISELYEKNGIEADNSETWTDQASNNVNFESLYHHLSEKLRSGDIKPEDLNLARGVLNKIEVFSVGAYRIGKADLTLDQLYKSGKLVCFLLKGLPEYLQKALVWSILEQTNTLFYNRYKVHEGLRLLIVVEEAHLFSKPVPADVPGGAIEPPLTRYIRMMRKIGHGLVAITHSPTDLPSMFLEAVGTLVLFGSTNADYIDFCTQQLQLSSEEAKQLQWMGRGECFLRFHADPRSIPVKIVAEPEVLTAKA